MAPKVGAFHEMGVMVVRRRRSADEEEQNRGQPYARTRNAFPRGGLRVRMVDGVVVLWEWKVRVVVLWVRMVRVVVLRMTCFERQTGSP